MNTSSEYIAALFAAAEKMRPGKRRDELLSKALALEFDAGIERWVNSPGVQPPNESPGDVVTEKAPGPYARD